MDTRTVDAATTSDRVRLRKLLPITGFACALVASGLTALGVFYRGPKHDHDHSPWEFYMVAAVVIVAAVVVFGFLLPRALDKEYPGGTALTLSSIAALLLLPAFWSGLPLVLGVGGALLGSAGRSTPAGAGKSVAAVAVGLLAALGYVAIYILDTVDRAGIL